MKKILGVIAGAVALLTLATLLIDLPSKITTGYEKLTGAVPNLAVNALFANQEALSLSELTDDKSRGLNRFIWPSVFEINNFSDKDITIRSIENILKESRTEGHVFQLTQRLPSNEILLYDHFQQLTGANYPKQGIEDRLPYTIKAGTKQYLKMHAEYIVTDNGSTVFCRIKADCYRLLWASLGVFAPEKDDFPCVLAKFNTKIDFVGYKSITTDQRAILLIVGCKPHIELLFRQETPPLAPFPKR